MRWWMCALLFICGCAGVRGSTYEVSPDGRRIVRKDYNASLLLPSHEPISPLEEARAFAIRERAKQGSQVPSVSMPEKGQGTDWYRMAFINNDTHRKLYVYNPESPDDKRVIFPDGDYDFIEVTKLPESMFLYQEGGRKWQVFPRRVYENKKNGSPVTIGGRRVQYVARID